MLIENGPSGGQRKTDDTCLRLVRGVVNPSGAGDKQLYLLQGDATREAVSLEAGAEAQLPPLWHFERRPFRLKILHFNDLHGHVANIVPGGSLPVFSKIAAYIHQARLASQGDPFSDVLAFSGGDDIAGSPFSILVGNDLASYQVHPAYWLYSQAGIDAAAIGNHEFDLGLDLLTHAARQDARFPLLSANLRPAPQLEGLCYPAAIFVLKGVRVGVIGLTTPAENRSRPDSEFEIVDPVPVARRLLPLVGSLSDVVILLSHLGQSLGSSGAKVAGAGDVELAQSLPAGSVSLIIGAHTHSSLNESGLEVSNVVNGIPIAQAGSNGRYLGEVDLVLRKAPIVAHLGLKYTEELPAAAGFEDTYVRPLLERMQPYLDQRLGRVMDSREMLAEGCCEDAAYHESALHNFITDGLVSCCRARGLEVDLAMLEASAIHAGLQPGQEFTYADWLQVMPYADTLMVCQLSSAELYDLIADNSRRIDIAGQPHIERGFVHFSKEVRYRIQINSDRSRIRASDIYVGGVPLDQAGERTYRVACTSFFRGLVHTWEEKALAYMPVLRFQPQQACGIDTGWFVNDLVLEHIRRSGGITPLGGAVQDGRMEVV